MTVINIDDVGFPPRRNPLRGDESAAEVEAVLHGISKPNGAAPDESDAADINILMTVEKFVRRFVVLPEDAYLPLAVWITATYLAAEFYVFPYVALASPAKRCGKTRLLEVFEVLCANPLRITSPSAAALFRMMASCPTLLVDEVEALKSKNASEVSQAILAILNSGYKKGATVPRCEPPSNKVGHFRVYGPKAFAAIGKLPDTLTDRSICIPMQRRTRAQKVERFSERRTPKEAESIKGLLEMLSQAKRETVRDAYESQPDLEFIEDREAEIWAPLFAVCAVAAPDRVGELKKCTLALTKSKAADDVEDSLPLKLLADMREVWPAGQVKMLTAKLLEGLRAIPDSPWAESGYELSPRKLARMLRPFDIEPRQIRVLTGTAKGYLWDEVEAAFSSYLPSPSNLSETCETTRVNIDENADFQSETEG